MNEYRDFIIQIKEAWAKQNKPSYSKIAKMLEKNNNYLAKSTLSNFFKEGSEDGNFDFKNTILPLMNVFLDLDVIGNMDINTLDEQGLRDAIQYKIQRIKDLETHIEDLKKQVDDLNLQLSKEKVKHYERIEQIQEQHNKRVDFLTNQISLKDKRIDVLLDANQKKDELNQKMTEQILNCPHRKEAQ